MRFPVISRRVFFIVTSVALAGWAIALWRTWEREPGAPALIASEPHFSAPAPPSPLLTEQAASMVASIEQSVDKNSIIGKPLTPAEEQKKQRIDAALRALKASDAAYAMENTKNKAAEDRKTSPVMAAARVNKPSILNLEEATPIQLVISALPMSEDELNDLFTGFAGAQESKKIKIGPFLSARVSARPDTVNIMGDDTRVRSTSSSEPMMWSWSLRPREPGPVTILVEVFSQDTLSADAAVRSVRVGQFSWNVAATGLAWWKYQLAQYAPLFTIATGLGTVLGWFGWKSRSSAPVQSSTSSKTARKNSKARKTPA